MRYFFGTSIAALRKVDEGKYRTSLNRRVTLKAEAEPAGFTPLIEWRHDGEAVRIGGSLVLGSYYVPDSAAFDRPSWEIQRSVMLIDPLEDQDRKKRPADIPAQQVGTYIVSVGPPGKARMAEIEFYSVEIVNWESNYDIVPEGEPVTFVARTIPPGYEDDINWLSSTMHGTALPILGHGASFTTQFDNTWGPHPKTGNTLQWLGVRADNTIFNQDQKSSFPPPGPMTMQSGIKLALFIDNVFAESTLFQSTLSVDISQAFTDTGTGLRQFEFVATSWNVTGHSDALNADITFQLNPDSTQTVSTCIAEQTDSDFPATMTFRCIYDATIVGLGTVSGLTGLAEGTVLQVPPGVAGLTVMKTVSIGNVDYVGGECGYNAVNAFRSCVRVQ